MFSLDVLGVVQGAPWQLREGLPVSRDTLSLHLEATLLRHGGVPADHDISWFAEPKQFQYSHVVRSQQGGVQDDIGHSGEAVVLRIMSRHVHHRVDI